MDTLVIAFLLYLIGALVRTVYGYLGKIVTEPAGTINFNAKYWATLILSIIGSMMAAAAVFPTLPLQTNVPLLYVALASLTSGYAFNDMINRGIGIVAGAEKVGKDNKPPVETAGG